MPSVRRALISVSDKTGLIELAQGLTALNIPILATSGTARFLASQGIPFTEVSEYTGFPEILQGRVKTLHPYLHGGILAPRDAESEAELRKYGIAPIDLVVVNLYPFVETIAHPEVSLAEAIEQIDIGGVALLRAAAKNFASVTVLTDPADYAMVLQQLQDRGEVGEETRLRLAQKAFAYTAFYDIHIASYLHSQHAPGTFPDPLLLAFSQMQSLRYGENPHQRAALYRSPLPPAPAIVNARQLHGKELSFNNIFDLDAARALLQEFPERPTAVVIKHTNPCGVAQGETLCAAYCRARDTDPMSAFGGIVGVNRPVDLETAQEMGAMFLEAILAPDFTPEALHLLRKKRNLRLLTLPLEQQPTTSPWELRHISGGVLLQESDGPGVDPSSWRVVSARQPTAAEMEALLFAWKVVKHVKSNAIVLAHAGQTIGIGAGQMSRVDAVQIACMKAVLPTAGAVMASDAFFPFRDSIDRAAEAGVRAVIQPGGSRRDAEVIEAADAHGMAMVFTGRRHFKH
ncbi:MAG: bifunctional phosphoribosylaminoimidazolecarboxamide formyltransferase/IMP cyclohydrolase PurH [Nitrospinota bacterium]|nr:MAG: bifunctional phosphoribosylaminoimidazolecarboxamide formyltransferase/IMP cyclohydrolase PurH [Nitrospinota bacterium]